MLNKTNGISRNNLRNLLKLNGDFRLPRLLFFRFIDADKHKTAQCTKNMSTNAFTGSIFFNKYENV